VSAGTFTQRRQIGVCKVCRVPVFREVTDDGNRTRWFHMYMQSRHFPKHDAVYLEGQKTTPAEALVLLTAWLKWHGHVLQCLYREEAWTATDDGGDLADYLDGPILHSWSTIDAATWHERYRP
jgi:hypothetical protein